MPVQNSLINLPLYTVNIVWLVFEVGALILAVLYFIFSLIVVRQVSLMTESLITEVSPLLRGLAIIHSGLALGVAAYFFWIFFK